MWQPQEADFDIANQISLELSIPTVLPPTLNFSEIFNIEVDWQLLGKIDTQSFPTGVLKSDNYGYATHTVTPTLQYTNYPNATTKNAPVNAGSAFTNTSTAFAP